MKKIIALITAGLIQFTLAHESTDHEHLQLVPMPAYNAKYGGASAKNATKAALVFLQSLSSDIKEKMVFEFDSAKRRGWSNLPVGIVPRVGMNVGSMSDEQRVLLFDFLSASLSKEGYIKVADTMAAEAFLSDDESAEKYQWAPENYWLSIYGDIQNDKVWAWQFGGHHLAINMTVGEDSITSMSPTFLGTEPAVFTYNGKEYSALTSIHKAGADVFASLSADEQKLALLGGYPSDVEVGPGRDNFVPIKTGIAVGSLNEEQKELVMLTIRQWVGTQPAKDATKRMSQIAEELDETYFAWIGDYGINKKCYFRIHSPSVIMELLSLSGNIGKSADGKGHYHTIYRNFKTDYGSEKKVKK